MLNTQLLFLIQQLSSSELNQFGSFIQSPFFNQNEKLISLWKSLTRAAPNFAETDTNKQEIYRQVYGSNEAFEAKRFNNLVSDVLQLLLRYLSIQELERKPILQQELLTNRLRDLDLPIILRKQNNKTEKLFQNLTEKNYEHFHQQYLHYEALDQIALEKSKREMNLFLQQKNDALDLYYLANKFRIACDMLSRKLITNNSYDCHFLDELETFYESEKIRLEKIPCILVYHQVLQMLRKPNEEIHFHNLKNTLRNNAAIFPEDELQTLYRYPINYCAIKINSGQSEYYEMVLELYKDLLERADHSDSSLMTQWTFKNIVTVGIRLKDFDWTKQFIQKHKSKLPLNEKGNAISYNLAAFHFATGAYTKALQQLQDVEFTDISYHVGAKIIQLKCYFELREFSALLALLEAFRTYVQRSKKIAPYRKKANLNLLRLTKRLYQLSEQKSLIPKVVFRKKFKDLEKQINELNPLTNKDWLQEMLVKLA